MTTDASPFLDQGRRHELYGDTTRLARRTGALLQAKTTGRPVPATIAQLAARHHSRPGERIDVVADIGCGRGTSSHVLAERLRPRRLLCIDAAPALLADARTRASTVSSVQAGFVSGDFHCLPLPGHSCTVAVAAFCLYHSPCPAQAVGEITRVLAPGGLAVLVTKSLDSYRGMDALISAAGLDPQTGDRASLYATVHGGNLADLAQQTMRVITIEHEEHTFSFRNLAHAAEYLSTSPPVPPPAWPIRQPARPRSRPAHPGFPTGRSPPAPSSPTSLPAVPEARRDGCRVRQALRQPSCGSRCQTALLLARGPRQAAPPASPPLCRRR